MKRLDFINKRGDVLSLLNNQYFSLTHVDGMTEGSASLSSSTVGGVDGDTVNNVQAQPRTIIFDLRVKSGIEVETAKREILKVIKLKQIGTLEWEQDDRTIIISGTVESAEMPRWGKGVVMQVTLHCSQPFWEDAETIVREISEAIDVHYFEENPYGMLYFPAEGIVLGEFDARRTKEFYNAGDVAVGLEITIVALGTVNNPIIYDNEGGFLGVGYGEGARKVTMKSGDVIVISTLKGKKTATLNGANVMHKVKPQSKWLQLETGDNAFTINSDDVDKTNMNFTITYKQRYL